VTPLFERDRFIAECEAAVVSGGGQREIRAVLEQAVNDPARVLSELGEPKRAGIELLYRSKNVTILNLVWGPHMTVMPHNHHMWAVIGMYTGREDNIFWRHLPVDAKRPIEAAGASSYFARDVGTLGADIVHSVTNPLGKLTGALHVYGGDFLKQHREQWHEETLAEQPYDQAGARQLFEDSNRFLDAR
jgi:predicted metal-dependent enzyme (double-stranded beta helix superfamily)